MTGSKIIGILFILAVLGLSLYLLVRPHLRKKMFNKIKQEHGKSTDVLFDSKTISEAINFLNEQSRKDSLELKCKTFTHVNIERQCIPLIQGTLNLTNSNSYKYDWTQVVFYTITKSKADAEFVQKHSDIFKLACSDKDISVFWVKNLRKLKACLGSLRSGGDVLRIFRFDGPKEKRSC